MAIRSEFDVHMLNEQGKKKAIEIATVFTEALNALERPSLCDAEGREMALVRTHMETAAFFAKRAMAKRAENQE